MNYIDISSSLEKLFQETKGVADRIGMGAYFDRLQEEMENDKARIYSINASRGKMWDILENNIPKKGEILIVQANNGIERRLIHRWAEHKGLKSIASRIDAFPEVYGWKCKECDCVYYNNEVHSTSDWGTRGQCFGSIIKCPVCYEDSTYSTDDAYDPVWDTIKPIRNMINSVAIGESVDYLKKVLNKGRRKKKKKYEVDHSSITEEKLKEAFQKLPQRKVHFIK